LPRRGRCPAALGFLVCAALLGTAAALSPAPQGFGTHTRLGLPPCSFQSTTGLPCATCGMTTSFAHAADGQLLQAAEVQPAGALLCVGAAMGLLVFGWALGAGASLAPLFGALGRLPVLLSAGGIVVVAWAWKMAWMG
jgi:hypothetical protein